ncbi:hypothetical protein ACP70R_041090 [Stipagrostis hirtigluma subsp. patula]
MRMSCNGCRVLRKGCGDACTIRPCLQWIASPDAQANATVFLAKFYGRAGLLNLLAAAPDDALRPPVFRSLLYEAAGRIVNPVYGSVGLLWSGQWQACQAAVEAVLRGDPVVQVSSDAAAPPLGGGASYDIRHVAKDADNAAAGLLRVSRAGRTRFKRAASSSASRPKGAAGPKPNRASSGSPRREQEPELEHEAVAAVGESRAPGAHEEESAGSHDHAVAAAREGSEDTEMEAGSHVSQAEPQSQAPATQAAVAYEGAGQEDEEVGLELTLGLEPAVSQARCDHSGLSLSAASSLMGLRLQLPA